MSHSITDIIIIGAGPAGLTAGMYAGRSGLQARIMEKTAPGGQLLWSARITNYPGFPDEQDPVELVTRMKKQAEEAGAQIISAGVEKVIPEAGVFQVRAGETYPGRAVIAASGFERKKLGVPGEESLIGKGVSYCAVCDGFFFRNRTVAVVGSGNPAAHEALFLSRLARRVYLVHPGAKMVASPDLRKEILSEPKITALANFKVKKISGREKVAGLRLTNRQTGKEKELELDGVFILAGYRPGTGFLPPETSLTERGYIVTDEAMATTLPGLFAAGDCRQKTLRQVVTACADGAMAAQAAHRYLERSKG